MEMLLVFPMLAARVSCAELGAGNIYTDTYNAHFSTLTVVVVHTVVAIAIAVLAFGIFRRIKKQRRLREIERTRTNFFVNVAHEFRTSLTVIISAAQNVLTQNKADKILQRDSVDIIRHGKGMLDLVNQILDIAKISSGGVNLPTLKRGDIVGFVARICEEHIKYAERRKLRIVYDADVDHLEMDFVPSYVIRIVQNLLSNAIKFSYPNSDILVFMKVVESDDGRTLKLYVCDTGVGMTRAQKMGIFEPFVQVNNDASGVGSGIGLSLVKLAADAMGGNVELHSYPLEGSVFIVAIPVKCDTPDVEPIDAAMYSLDLVDMFDNYAPEDQESPSADAPRVLIVEDAPDVACWQMRQLNPEYSFYFAADGEKGYVKAQEIMPDIIITDAVMPLMDGYEFCRKVRKNESMRHIPVIMVSAKSTVEDRIRGLESGADAYVEKPFHPGELAVRVEKLLEQRKMLRSVYSENVESKTTSTSQEMAMSDRVFVENLSTKIHEYIVKGKIDYEELAASFYVGKTQLNRKIKAITGCTTTEYILQIRISMAKQLLAKTNYPIGKVASIVGIDDVAYFSSVFRKNTGKTPTAFRRR